MLFEPLSSENLDFKSALLSAISPQFNNADFSDITFNVGGTRYFAHRFLLAAQSNVFEAMLTGPHWKESEQKEIDLEEEEDTHAVFPLFLKFFYTGKIKLEYPNVCAIHTLADKYAILSIKKSCVDFITETLRGQAGITLLKSVEWLPYVEQYIPELVCDCYKSIRFQFHGLLRTDVKLCNLDLFHLRALFRTSESELVVPDELFVYNVIQEWLFQTKQQNTMAVVTELMDCIRFYNMDPNQLRAVEDSRLGKLHYDSHFVSIINQAFRKQAEYRFLADSSPKRRKMDNSNSQAILRRQSDIPNTLPMEPRLYYEWPFGQTTQITKQWDCPNFEWINIEVVDLRTLSSFANKISDGPSSKSERWMCKWNTDHIDSEAGIFQEEFIVYPSPVHENRAYTLVIKIDGTCRNPNSDPNQTYTIRMKGSVNPGMLEIRVCSLIHSWKVHAGFKLSILVLLEKLPVGLQAASSGTHQC